jgi:hypothetical protein
VNGSTRMLLERAQRTADRLRAAGKSDRANRFCGRAEVVITRNAARNGELVPTLYVSSDGRWLTTWPGNRVAPLAVTGSARGFHGVKLTCYRATIEGRVYHGRGQGPGMYINLRPSKRGGK